MYDETLLISPPAIVRSVDENSAERDHYFWHEQAKQADSEKNLSNLKHAEALYHISLDDNFKKLGYKDMREYAFKEFNRSGSWVQKLIKIHEKFVVELGVDRSVLEEVTFGKLSILASQVNAENVSEILEEAKHLSQKDLADRASKIEIQEGDKAAERKLIFKGPVEIVESIESALAVASDNILSGNNRYNSDGDIPSLLKLEYICSTFLATVSLDGNPAETLERICSNIESVYNLKVILEDKNEAE
jgi:hypothetical protein